MVDTDGVAGWLVGSPRSHAAADPSNGAEATARGRVGSVDPGSGRHPQVPPVDVVAPRAGRDVVRADAVPCHLRPILEQLLTGATDQAASRRLSMSPRTFSRRVSELLEHLGVSTRFQAGLEMAARGWVRRARDSPPRPSAPAPHTAPHGRGPDLEHRAGR